MNREYNVGDFVKTEKFGYGVVVQKTITFDTNFPLLVYFFNEKSSKFFDLFGQYQYQKDDEQDLKPICGSDKFKINLTITTE